MKKIKFLSLLSTALVGVTLPAWAGPHGGGFGGGGHFGGGHFGGYSGGGFRAAPAFPSSGARFSGKSLDGVSRAPQFYYGGARMSAVQPYSVAGSAGRSITSYAGSRAAINHQPNRVGSVAGRNRVSDSRISDSSKPTVIHQESRVCARHVPITAENELAA